MGTSGFSGPVGIAFNGGDLTRETSRLLSAIKRGYEHLVIIPDTGERSIEQLWNQLKGF